MGFKSTHERADWWLIHLSEDSRWSDFKLSTPFVLIKSDFLATDLITQQVWVGLPKIIGLIHMKVQG